MIQFLKNYVIWRYLPAMPMLILLFTGFTPVRDQSQDVNFRLINIERRIDQLQQRVDFIERSVQNQAFNRSNESNTSTAVVLELQRQQLSLAGQVVSLQKQMLTIQQAIDQLQEKKQDQKEKPEGEEKPRNTPGTRKKGQ